MNLVKYIGLDVHKAMTAIVVINDAGKVVADAIIETKAEAILGFILSQRGTLHVALEEGTQAAWLYDLIRSHVEDDARSMMRLRDRCNRSAAGRRSIFLRDAKVEGEFQVSG